MVLRNIRSRPLVGEKLSKLPKNTYSDVKMEITDSYILAVGGHPIPLNAYVDGIADVIVDEILEVSVV